MGTSDGSVLVTGALGCIGAWTVRELVLRDEPVVALDRSRDTRRLELVATPDQLEKVRLVEGDITDLATVERIIDEEGVTRVIHLGALQLPFCRADPPTGALVNVVGTVNIFEAARGASVSGVVYTSSMAVFDRVEGGSVTPDTVARPASHYGAYKLANEGTARAYWEDFGVSSIGIRPMTVFGPGRDQGLTSSPTKAIVAAVLGCRYEIGFGGSTLFHFAPDAGRALATAASVPAAGAHVYNLNGSRASIPELVDVLGRVVGEAAERITYKPDPLPFPDDIDTTGLEILGPPPVTPLPEAVAATVELFRALQRDGRLVPEEQGLAVDGDVAVDAPAGRHSGGP
jgi:nucleoside-diphosphate-sugar epimerase